MFVCTNVVETATKANSCGFSSAIYQTWSSPLGQGFYNMWQIQIQLFSREKARGKNLVLSARLWLPFVKLFRSFHFLSIFDSHFAPSTTTTTAATTTTTTTYLLPLLLSPCICTLWLHWLDATEEDDEWESIKMRYCLPATSRSETTPRWMKATAPRWQRNAPLSMKVMAHARRRTTLDGHERCMHSNFAGCKLSGETFQNPKLYKIEHCKRVFMVMTTNLGWPTLHSCHPLLSNQSAHHVPIFFWNLEKNPKRGYR